MAVLEFVNPNENIAKDLIDRTCLRLGVTRYKLASLCGYTDRPDRIYSWAKGSRPMPMLAMARMFRMYLDAAEFDFKAYHHINWQTNEVFFKTEEKPRSISKIAHVKEAQALHDSE